MSTTPKLVSLDTLQSAIERVKTEYEADIADVDAGVSTESIATEAEVSAMLDSVFGTTEETPTVE